MVDAIVTAGEMEILCHPDLIYLTTWWVARFSLMTNFMILDSGAKGILTNIYGPSEFSQNPPFLYFLSWIKGKVGDSSWIMGEDFNLKTYLGEKKGGGGFCIDSKKLLETSWNKVNLFT